MMDNLNIRLLDVAAGSAALYLLVRLLTSKNSSAPLPPGPKRKPLVGNLSDLPSPGAQEWVHWHKHRELYGPISSITVLGATIVIINDVRVAFDLLDRRSATYSDRPSMTFANEMCGWAGGLFAQQCNERFRRYRRDIHTVMGSKSAVRKFRELQTKEVRRFCLRVLEDPERLQEHIRTEAGAIILNIAYGYDIDPYGHDPLVDTADQALTEFGEAVTPGKWLVDQLYFLKFVPDWLPGANFKRVAARFRKTVEQLTEKPYAFVKRQLAQGRARPSLVTGLIDQRGDDLTPDDEFMIKWIASSMYGGGADTTVSSQSYFFLAMVKFPDVQRRAQEELDRVVGSERLPTFEDRKNLPYIDAIVKEVLRWHPVAPMGLPHVAAEDDVYEGCFIPKGSILQANIWSFTHDPAVFHDPFTFKPERFLGPTPEPDPHTMSFGFGRRICPGRELADASLFLSIATTLAAFEIAREVVDGKEVEPHVGFGVGLISHPEPYKCVVRPRSEKAASLVKEVAETYPFEESDAKELQGLDV